MKLEDDLFDDVKNGDFIFLLKDMVEEEGNLFEVRVKEEDIEMEKLREEVINLNDI